MRKWLRITGGLTLLLVGMLLCSHLGGKAAYRPLPGLPVDLILPGRLLPGRMRCYYHDVSYSGWATCCTDTTPNVYYDIDSQRTVQDVLVDQPGGEVGDYLLLWGTPTGASYGHSWTEIFWPEGRQIWVAVPLSPTARVSFAEFDPKDVPDTPWLGFRTVTPMPR